MRKNINRDSHIPLYVQLMDLIIKGIHENEYPVGSKLPTERELCAIYQVSRITVRQALKELEQRKYIIKQHGKGNFVLNTNVNTSTLAVFSFSENAKKQGQKPMTKVTEFEIVPASEEIAKILNISLEEDIIKCVRLRYVDNQPKMYELSYLPRKLFRHLNAKDLEKYSMYDIFSKDYQLEVERAVEEFSCTLLNDKEAHFLQSKPRKPAILIKRVAYHQDIVVEYTLTVVNDKDFYMKIEHNK